MIAGAPLGKLLVPRSRPSRPPPDPFHSFAMIMIVMIMMIIMGTAVQQLDVTAPFCIMVKSTL
jgi:hypothetical protein